MRFFLGLLVSFALFSHPVSAGLCCIWKSYEDISRVDQLIEVPQTPPTSACSPPYFWSSCGNLSSCINIYCSATVNLMGPIKLNGYNPSCLFDAQVYRDELDKMEGVDNVVCTSSPGVYFDNSMTSAIITSPETTSSLPVSSTSMSMLQTAPPTTAPPITAGPLPSPSSQQVQAANYTTWTPPKLAWTALNLNISARSATGFAAMPDGMLYVIGGGVDGKRSIRIRTSLHVPVGAADAIDAVTAPRHGVYYLRCRSYFSTTLTDTSNCRCFRCRRRLPLRPCQQQVDRPQRLRLHPVAAGTVLRRRHARRDALPVRRLHHRRR
jgi:hypothetical protein